MQLFWSRNASASPWSRLGGCLALLLSVWLAGCGGSGTTGDNLPTLALMRDSFGQAVAEADFGAGVSTAAGVDGTASDEQPIANALVKVIDNAGNSVVGKTNAQGYYRVRVDGFVPPLIASVTRPDGQVHFAASATAIKVRGFITLNLTSLTDKLASDVAVAAGLSSAAQLSTKLIATDPTRLEKARVSFNALWANVLTGAGLDAGTFDAVSKAFKADGTGYSKVLGNFVWSLNNAGTTVLTPRATVGGNIVGLGNRTGLTLTMGTETLVIPAQATSFTFTTPLAQNAAYSVNLASQPAGLSCGITNASGNLVTTAVNNVLVLCSAVTDTVGGAITGLGSSSDLVLGSAGQTLAVPANAQGFVFAQSVPLGTSYAVYVVSQPQGKTCGVAFGSGVQQGTGPITTVRVVCTVNTYVLGGNITGLTQSGLVLFNGDQVVSVRALSKTFEFLSKVPYGSSYQVSITSQPQGQTCTVSNGTGTVGAADVRTVSISCVTNSFPLGGLVNGLTGPGLILVSNGQALAVAAGSTTFEFAQPLPYGTLYNVVIMSQPTDQTCIVTGASGKIAETNLDAVIINCYGP